MLITPVFCINNLNELKVFCLCPNITGVRIKKAGNFYNYNAYLLIYYKLSKVFA